MNRTSIILGLFGLLSIALFLLTGSTDPTGTFTAEHVTKVTINKPSAGPSPGGSGAGASTGPSQDTTQDVIQPPVQVFEPPAQTKQQEQDCTGPDCFPQERTQHPRFSLPDAHQPQQPPQPVKQQQTIFARYLPLYGVALLLILFITILYSITRKK